MNKKPEIIIGGITYEAVEDVERKGCEGCALERFDSIDCAARFCLYRTRDTGKSIIFRRVIKTNGDRLRAMSNEELARWICNHGDECKGNRQNGCYLGEKGCVKCWEVWLEHEAEK